MKLNFKHKWMAVLITACATSAQANAQYTNYIRQTQFPVLPTGTVSRIMPDLAPVDQAASPLEINEAGARFDLFTMNSTTLAEYLLDSRFVGAYVPIAEIAIQTEDVNSPVPRTRADRPFDVIITVSGLRSGAGDPAASKSVNFFHHTQSYGEGGTGTEIDRTQATLASQVSIDTNVSLKKETYTLTTIAGADRSKIRGEERFSIFSLTDFQAPSSQLAAQTVQIWPVAHGTISGISDNETIEFSTPTLTLAFNDIYPGAGIYAQIYKGEKRDDGYVGTVVPGSAYTVNEAIPENRLFTVSEWDSIITENGTWTMEQLTTTPFGIDRLDWVTFNVDRTISVNGSVTTAE